MRVLVTLQEFDRLGSGLEIPRVRLVPLGTSHGARFRQRKSPNAVLVPGLLWPKQTTVLLLLHKPIQTAAHLLRVLVLVEIVVAVRLERQHRQPGLRHRGAVLELGEGKGISRLGKTGGKRRLRPIGARPN